MVGFAGYSLPVHYPAGIMEEHLWTRASASLFDVSHMGQIVLRGAHADRALETLVTADVIGLSDGRMRYGLLTNPQGGVIDDLMITRRGDEVLLVVNGACKAGDLAHLQAALAPLDVDVAIHDDLALLALQGPQAGAVMEQLAPASQELWFMQAGWLDIAGAQCWVSRSGYTGEDGFEISVAGKDALTVAEALLAHDAVRPAGLGARDSLRLEAGLPLYGHDLTGTTSPVEASLSFAISKRRKMEGGFSGSDVALVHLLDGPPRRRVGLRLEGRQPAREGADIVRQGEVIGQVTSGGFSPTLGAPIAMGYIASAYAEDGTAVDLMVRGKALAAVVAPLPFVATRYRRKTS